jgi:DNA polymerase I-like protein with 3'-5' exonuclease and polymerase domains
MQSSTSKLIAVDIETAGPDGLPGDLALDHNRNTITKIAVYGSDTKFVVNGGHGNDVQLVLPNDARFVFHNGKFDIKTLVAKDHWLTPDHLHEDTMVMAVVFPHKIPDAWLEEYEASRKALNAALGKNVHRNAGGYSLKTLAPYFLGVKPFYEVEDHANDEYALKDAEYTYRLAEFFLREMNEEQHAFYQKIQAWNRMLLKAELYGAALDFKVLAAHEESTAVKETETRAQLEKEWAEHFTFYTAIQKKLVCDSYHEKCDAALAKLKDPTDAPKVAKTMARYQGLMDKAVAKIEPFNLGSPTQLKWLFKDRLGVDITTFSGDEESTGKAVLERLVGEGVAGVDTFLKWRKASKLITAFFPSYRAEAFRGRIHTSYNLSGTRTGRLSSSGPNCLSMDTELLTDKGWKLPIKFDREADKVAVWRDGSIAFEHVRDFFVKDYAGEGVNYDSEHIAFSGTADHRMLVQTRKGGKYEVQAASELKPDCKWIQAGLTRSEGLNMSDSAIRQAVAIQADGSLGHKYYEITVSKPRKIERLKELFGCREYSTPAKPSVISFKTEIAPGALSPLLDENKCFVPAAIAQMSLMQLDLFIEEIHHWDGLYTRKDAGLAYTSKHRVNADAVCMALTLSGRRAKVTTRVVDGKLYWNVYGTYRNYTMTTNAEKSPAKLDVVWCVTVSSGFFVARRRGNPFVTGNCQQIPKDILDIFAAPAGSKLVYRDVSAIEPRLIAYETECPNLCKIFLDGSDFHSFNVRDAIDIQEEDAVIKSKYQRERDLMKEVGLSLMYGASWRRIQESSAKRGFKWTEKFCKMIYRRFQQRYERVWEFKQALEQAIKAGEVVTNVLGRPLAYDMDRLHMQSLNTKIQSGGSDLLLESVYRAAQVAEKRNISFKPILFIHDAAIIESLDADSNMAYNILGEAIAGWELKTVWGTIPLLSEGGVYQNLPAKS